MINQIGITALMFACAGGHASLVALLLDAGADVHLADNVSRFFV
jgi:ankyrin repeat protein